MSILFWNTFSVSESSVSHRPINPYPRHTPHLSSVQGFTSILFRNTSSLSVSSVSHRPINRYPTYTSNPQYSVFHINSIILLQDTCHTFSIECITWIVNTWPRHTSHLQCSVFHIDLIIRVRKTLHTFDVQYFKSFQNPYLRHSSHLQCSGFTSIRFSFSETHSTLPVSSVLGGGYMDKLKPA